MKIYVGLDKSQLLPAKVLSFSIKKYSKEKCEIIFLQDLNLPIPKKIENRQRTGFSFSRFCIPKINGYKGKAIYLDADMLVFKDLSYLWRLEMNNCSVMIKTINKKTDNEIENTLLGKKQLSVMLLDCSKLTWDIYRIINGLDNEEFSYNQLMQDLIIEKKENISTSLPLEWNSLDFYNHNTCLLHYTSLKTQPWVSPKNKYKKLWNNALRELLIKKKISLAEIHENIMKGYTRPSLMLELRYPFLEKKFFNKILEIFDKFKKFEPYYKKKKLISIVIND